MIVRTNLVIIPGNPLFSPIPVFDHTGSSGLPIAAGVERPFAILKCLGRENCRDQQDGVTRHPALERGETKAEPSQGERAARKFRCFVLI